MTPLEPDGSPMINQADGTPFLISAANKAYQNGTDIHLYLIASNPNPAPGIGTWVGDTGTPQPFKGFADDRPSPKTPTGIGQKHATAYPNDKSPTPTNREDQSSEEYLTEDEGELYNHPYHKGWIDGGDNPRPGPSTPLNKPYVHFDDTEATPKPIPRATEVLDDFEMSEAESTTEMDPMAQLLQTVLKRIIALDRREKTPPTPTKYHNDPALVEKVATLTTKVAELERLIFFIPRNPPLPPATGRPPPRLPALPPPSAKLPGCAPCFRSIQESGAHEIDLAELFFCASD
ncbi:hypothetical protein Q9L58_010611 [Maublancomyces gigas]|uniref:Uncharacterized protein n=1 Tax=Discina gigas TaxID=1032678 RepID=A0ABR3G3K8_9PEZI